MGNQKLEYCDIERDLGVIMSTDLKVESQCNEACLKANRMLGLIKRTFVVKTPEVMLNLVSRHFGPKTFRHHCDGAEVSRHFGTGAEVSYGHFGTSAEMSGTPDTLAPPSIVCYTKRKLHAHTIKRITHIMSHVCTTNKWNKPASANTMSCDSVVLCGYYF